MRLSAGHLYGGQVCKDAQEKEKQEFGYPFPETPACDHRNRQGQMGSILLGDTMVPNIE